MTDVLLLERDQLTLGTTWHSAGEIGYGHALGGAVGIGFVELDEPVTADVSRTGGWTITVAGERSASRRRQR